MFTRTMRRWSAVAIVALMLGGCATSGDDDDLASDNTEAPDTSASSDTTTSTELTASARGVTAEAIKIGFSYIDLQTLAESGIIRVDHGPYEEIIQALVDDVNANGGINGRTLELVTAKYSPIGNEEQLAACTRLTEDEQVFAVLNGLLNENNLCIVEQHETVLVSTSGLTAARLSAARAPWATSFASAERSVDALVQVLDANGELEGATIGVYAAQAGNQGLIDVAVQALEEAGYQAAETALLDTPEGDVQAATAQNTVIAQRMMDAGVDTLLNVGLFVPGADFDAAGFHPRMYSLEQGNLAAAAFTNPLGNFPFVGALGAIDGDADPMENPAFQRCIDVYETATGNEVKSPQQEDLDGESSGFTALQIACATLDVFVAAATAAGPELTNESFGTAVESLGEIDLPNVTLASFGPAKPDAQDSFQLMQFDATWEEGQGRDQFIAVGDPIELGQ